MFTYFIYLYNQLKNYFLNLGFMENGENDFSNEEIEGIDEEQSESFLYPIDRDKIKVTVNNWTVFTFKEYLKRKKIELQPVFQRSYVWNDEKAA